LAHSMMEARKHKNVWRIDLKKKLEKPQTKRSSLQFLTSTLKS
jgi:hypothetical protein